MRPITVVATVLNEREGLDPFLVSLLAQTLPPREIIITDGGSSDGTWEALQAWASRDPRIRPISMPGANRSQGRNGAISQAETSWIAVTDAGSIARPDWLERLVQPLKKGYDVASGFYSPLPQTRLEAAIGALTLPSHPGKAFLPSSRSVAFLKQAWEEVGGYPEDLTYNEDTPFDLALKAAGFRFGLAADAIVDWRPRGSFGALFRQFKAYARGDSQAGLFPLTYLRIFLGYLSLLLFLLPGLGILPLAYWAVRLLRDALKIWDRDPWALPYLLPVRVVIDSADLLGYLQGWRERRSG